MLSPKQHAKIEVLKHVSNMMDTMMSSKMKKKPVAMHMEAEVLPKSPLHVEGSPSEEVSESPDLEAKEESLGTEIPEDHHIVPKTPDVSVTHPHGHGSELDESDLARLKEHYSSLK